MLISWAGPSQSMHRLSISQPLRHGHACHMIMQQHQPSMHCCQSTASCSNEPSSSQMVCRALTGAHSIMPRTGTGLDSTLGSSLGSTLGSGSSAGLSLSAGPSSPMYAPPPLCTALLHMSPNPEQCWHVSASLGVTGPWSQSSGMPGSQKMKAILELACLPGAGMPSWLQSSCPASSSMPCMPGNLRTPVPGPAAFSGHLRSHLYIDDRTMLTHPAPAGGIGATCTRPCTSGKQSFPRPPPSTWLMCHSHVSGYHM